LLLVAVSVMAPAGAGAQQAEEWLMRMVDAVEHLNYEGTFIYMTPGKVETFKVFHRVEKLGAGAKEIAERIIALDGAGAEIIRSSDELICIFPKQKLVVVESRSGKGAKGNPFLDNLPRYTESLAQLYEIRLIGTDRAMDREVAVISISPRDAYRFGYRLWLDKMTAMPLKSQLIGADQAMPLEEIRFTQIRLPRLVASAAVQTQLDTSGYAWNRHTEETQAKTAAENRTVWRAQDLPVGFELLNESVEHTNFTAVPRTHLVYSDGLATVSVFVDVAVAASEQAEGLSMMGAANAYSLMKQGWLVTAMGEVPPQTVEKIASSTEAVGE
jgi:sigma-E factor negative regulatory protein RseB